MDLKRLFDIAASAFALLLLSPLFLFVGCGVSLVFGSPILFRQSRPGLHEKPFELLKFRSMHAPSPNDASDVRRLPPFGKWLRRWSLDELPQFLNVLKGDMSLVGPRPLLTKYLPFYTNDEKARHGIRPGMTGWAQVHGRNMSGWDERLALDVWYVRNHSFSLDTRILFLSVGVVLTGKGLVEDPLSASLVDLDFERQKAD